MGQMVCSIRASRAGRLANLQTTPLWSAQAHHMQLTPPGASRALVHLDKPEAVYEAAVSKAPSKTYQYAYIFFGFSCEMLDQGDTNCNPSNTCGLPNKHGQELHTLW